MTRKCLKCKKRFEPKNGNQVVCSIECARDKAKSDREKKDKEEIKHEKRETAKKKREQINKLKTYTQKLNDAKAIFQKWVRHRDGGLPCISCGATTSNPCWDGGHYKKAELFRGVIFHEDNCSRQCRKCNFYNDGNESLYREGLIKKIGEYRVKELEQLAEQTKRYKYSDDELKMLTEKYKSLLKESA